MLNFFDLDTVNIIGQVQVGQGADVLEFPIRIERGATEGTALAELLQREQTIREKMFAPLQDVQAKIVRAESLATPDTQHVTNFIELVSGGISGLSRSLTDVPEGTPKAKFKPNVEEVVQQADAMLTNIGEWSSALFVTPEQVEEANKQAIEATQVLQDAKVTQARELHRLRAERIAFWCPDWKAEKDGQVVPIGADLLEKRSPELLAQIEEEISKKAPRRSVLL